MSHLEFVPDGYDSPIRLLRTPKEVVAAMAEARREFTERLARGGLSVTNEAAQRWWPVAETKAAMKTEVS